MSAIETGSFETPGFSKKERKIAVINEEMKNMDNRKMSDGKHVRPKQEVKV